VTGPAQALDPAANRLPRNVRRIHLLGVCGTGMAALAAMLQDLGHQVSGSDQAVYPPMSDFLARRGIPVADGYRPEDLDEGVDLVVIGNVVRADNPMVARVRRLGIAYLSMPQALAAFCLQGRTPLVVAGTHGKTTTSSLLATVLDQAGLAPGFFIGGLAENFGVNGRLGQGDYFVLEGDEYDTAFFDKEAKFFHYRPHGAILTSVEFDHADIFADFAAVRRAFSRFVAMLPPGGVLAACGDDETVCELAGACRAEVVRYGFGPDCDYQVRSVIQEGMRSRFQVCRLPGEEDLGYFTMPLPGRHNVANGAAVLALLHRLGLDPDTIRRGMAAFAGVKRRQQVRGEAAGVTVIDDFAHHPTAVRETVAAIRGAYPGRRLVVVFEPRTNSSRRRVFQSVYPHCFSGADRVVLREPTPLPGLRPEEMFSSSRLAAALRAQGLDAQAYGETDAILADLEAFLASGDVVLICSNGGFDDLHERLLARLARRAG